MGGYGFCAATPDLVRSYLGSGSLAAFLKEVPFFHIGFNFDARAEVEGGIKMFGSEKTSFSDDNYDYYGMVTAKAKVGAWAEFSTPPNPIFQVAGDIRGGLKIGIGYQLAGPFRKQAPDHGGFFLIAGGIEAYTNLHSFIFNWSGRAGLTWGKKWLFPDDNDHNPFHSKYPWWAVKKEARTVAESYRKLPQLGATTFGQTLISDVAADANPHFIDESHVVYNDLKDPANYNDDSVVLLNTDDNTTTDISQSDKTTTRHMRSKRGEHEIVVYEELAQTIDASEVTSDKVLDKSDEIAAHTFLAASIKNTATGEWTKTNITTDDGTVDSKPVVTIQDDGKTACIWQRGTMHEVEQTVSNEKYFTNSFEYDISYPQAAVMASKNLPLNLVVRNTGTSSIHQATATINGTQFEIADSYVPPLQSRSFVVNYPIGDDFDGYISSDVAVVYDNVFQSQYHPLRKNVSFRRQVKSKEKVNIGMEDIEYNLIGHSVENGVNNFVVELIDRSVRGLNARNAVHVGIYAHPTNVEPILDDAETIVTASDFMEIGGQCKAYATVKVARVSEPIRAYLNTHIYNSEQSTLEAAHVDNRSGLDNAHYITLLPHNDPTVVEQIVKDGGSYNVSFVVKKENGGLRISSLEHGSHLRVYGINGVQLFDRQNAEGEVFVPLKEHQLYIISNGKELLKFAF